MFPPEVILAHDPLLWNATRTKMTCWWCERLVMAHRGHDPVADVDRGWQTYPHESTCVWQQAMDAWTQPALVASHETQILPVCIPFPMETTAADTSPPVPSETTPPTDPARLAHGDVVTITGIYAPPRGLRQRWQTLLWRCGLRKDCPLTLRQFTVV